MRVGLGIPFHSVERSRVDAHRKALSVIGDLVSWSSVTVAGVRNKDGSFNRGASRNHLVRALEAYDVVVLCDGDSYPEQRPLQIAIQRAAIDGRVHIPFDTVHHLRPHTDRWMFKTGRSAGGCFVMAPKTWTEIGLMEERGGYSVDDRSFLVQMNTFKDGPVFHPGSLSCWWHKRDETAVSEESVSIIDDYLRLEYHREDLARYLGDHPRDTPGTTLWEA